MYINSYHRRVEAVFLFFLFFFLAACLRLFFIQLFRSNYLISIAKKQHNLFVELEPRRGAILDTHFKPQAVNLTVDSVYACPIEIKGAQKEAIIRKLMPILNADYASLKNKLYRNKSFVWLARKINPLQAQQIKNLGIKGIDFIKESKRCYPNGHLASHILGFAGLDNSGLEGSELLFDSYLKGEAGWALMLRDARQKKLDLSEKMVLPKDGYDVVLTIDEVIQYIAERELDEAFKKYRAKGAMIIVMDPHTGAILALANRPAYDLNSYQSFSKESRRNRAITDMFEPGSVFKIVTAAAALEEKKVKEPDKFFCENGAYRVANHILHDHHPHGWLTFTEVIEESSNIGTTKIAQLLGPGIIYKYARLFGFGSKLRVDLPGEISGWLKEPQYWSKTSIGAVPIGQEVGVSALQLASALSAIANGGQLMKPYIVKQIQDKQREIIKDYPPQLIHKVISLDTAQRVKSMLQGAVDHGTGKLAKLDEFAVAGKTGTAQKIEAGGGYSHSKYTASFIGFAPAEDPLVTIVVVVDEPRPYYFGGVVAAPVFKNVARDVIRYLKNNMPLEEAVKKDETQRITQISAGVSQRH